MGIAKWWKIDFHTHTPASRCFKNFKQINESEDKKKELAKQWIEKSIENEIDAVVVCDHNSIEWIETLREANKALDNKIVIFPGIEICLTINKMHMLVIFDPSTTEEMHRTFIEQCKIPKINWGDTEKYISEDDLITTIEYFKKEYKEKIILIPAHYNKNKGMGKSLTDEGIKEFLKKIKIDAIEVRDEEGDNIVNSKIHSGILPNIATIVGSDNPGKREGEHSVEGLGQKYTWIKMSEPSLEGIRQALLDSESRIIKVVDVLDITENPNITNHNYLAGITVKDLKHINNVNVRFSPNFNCIVGARGTGKSTIIESIKLALNKGQDLKNLKVINKTYKEGSNIDLYYNFGVSKPYLITVNGKKTSPHCTVIDSIRQEIDNPPEFSATIFEQKEIYNLVENEDDIDKNESSPLLKIIDNNIIIDKIDIQEKIRIKKNELSNLGQKLDNSRIKLKEVPKIRAEVENSSSNLEKFRTSGILKKKERLDNLKNNLQAINSSLENIEVVKDTFLTNIKSSISDYKNIDKSTFCDKGSLLCSDLDNEINKFQIFIEQFEKSTSEYFDKINQVVNESNLSKSVIKYEQEYVELLEENTEIQVDKYKQIVENNTKNLENLKKLEDEAKNKEDIKGEIATKIEEYISEAVKITNKRSIILDGINSSAENIKLHIYPMSHGIRWLQNIRRDVGKKDNFDSQFSNLYNTLFVDGVLDIETYKKWLKFLLTTDTGDISEFLENNELDYKFKAIWANKFKDNTLSSLFNIELEDRVDIKIVSGNEEMSINEGSPGQRSAAILAFILNQGNEPLIIDQPEDDLDNSLIIKLVVDNIRKQKNNRQIIIVTHNPNIPVLGDAEGIIMLDRNENGEVSLKFNKATGCIEEKTIKKGICDIMEGGINAFKKRENKYKYLKL